MLAEPARILHITTMNGSAATIPAVPFTYKNALRFYIPLVLQAISQSLTYPLVAAITSRGVGGVANLAAFAQGQAVMFLLGTVGAGILTTGMVYGRSAEGCHRLIALNRRIMLAVLALSALCAIPLVSRWVFTVMLGLQPPLDRLATRLFLLSIPAQALFFIRVPWLAILYVHHATLKANIATSGRILLTLLFSPLFIHLDWVGPYWGLVAFTIPVAIETVFYRIMAAPMIRRLPPASPEDTPTIASLFAFCMPLSLGGFFLSLSGFMVGAFIARAAEPTRMLAIHYIAMGLVNPVSFAATRLQAVVIAFPPHGQRDFRTLRFALAAGLALGLIPQFVQLPSLSTLYLGTVQNLPPTDVPLARLAIFIMTLFPFVQAIRGHSEGLAAWSRQPNAILAGQAVYLSTLVVFLFAGLSFHIPGFLMGVIALIAASLATTATVRMAVNSARQLLLRPILENKTEAVGPL